MNRWLACELHTHTVHSDGRQTLNELAQGAKALGFDCIALTDHNTMSGLSEREAVEAETGIAIIPGMEWTTFYGHMVTIGLTEYADWRKAERTNLLDGIADVHRCGGLAGMAHPFRIGSPICTGCRWEYEIADWRAIDYIEVWSGTFPQPKTDNARAFALWTERLDAGCRIAAVSGRDWHAQTPVEEPIAVTYLEAVDEAGRAVPDNTAGQAVKALKAGRASVTIGPLLTLAAEAAGIRFGLGSVVPAAFRRDGLQLRIGADFKVRPGKWELPPQTYTLRLTGNAGVVGEWAVDGSGGQAVVTCDIGGGASAPGWIRAELWGVVRGIRTMIAFTNAIYMEGRSEEL
ncbi:CehA/McbA family metallohydrolase [Paenibacillus humicola]|uniref:CehA/McbA family metallohydrolase n=1 Tax=Paenibacillus humicola TaxID=3110540 RepID=UPI00237BB1A4|nr:CehA/McbA family metallohydrolase [Paenibacillus humicola]